MIIISRPSRRVARVVARAGAASASLLAVSVWAVSSTQVPAAHAAATDAGAVQLITPRVGVDGGVPLTSGGSATRFSLGLPAGAACTGDSANQSYLVQTYMVPVSVAPATLTFDSDGPTARDVGSNFRQPLHDVQGSPIVSQLTAPASPPPGPGPVINLDSAPLSFAVFGGPADLPAGAYNVGVACTLGPASATQLDKFWNLRVDVVAATAPNEISWSVAQTTATTTTTQVGATTTTQAGSTTTAAGNTTTTRAGSTTTASGGTTTTASGGSTSTSAGGGGQLSRTGGQSIPLLVWAFLLLVLGRMVVLVTRTPKVE